MKARKIAVSLMVFILFAFQFPMGSHGEISPEDVDIEHGKTQEFGGGNYIEARYGDFRVGVVYGSNINNNDVIIYSTGKNTLKEVEHFDGGRLIKKDVVSARTLIYERISRIIEFRDINNNSRFDSLINESGRYVLTSRDYPVGGIDIEEFSGRAPTININENNISINLTIRMRSPRENMKWDDIKGRMVRVNGEKIADSISINFVINISFKKESIEIPHFSFPYAQEDGSVRENADLMEVSVRYSLGIEGWKYRYPDSKLFVESETGMFIGDDMENTAICANITSSSPKYVEINGSYPLDRPKAIYGHSIRLLMENMRMGEIRGNRFSLVNGNNSSYVSLFCGSRKKLAELGGDIYEGFTINRTDSYFQGNISTGERISLKYHVIPPFQPVDAAPWWAEIIPFEVMAVSIFAVFLRIRVKHP